LVLLALTGNTEPVDVGSTVQATVAAEAPSPGSAAMRAYVNPETGALEVGVAPVNSPALDPDTENALRRDASGLVERRRADGSVSMNLQGRFQSVSVLKMGEEGDVVVCTENADEVDRTLQGETTPEVK
jgi:hypothetical protein